MALAVEQLAADRSRLVAGLGDAEDWTILAASHKAGMPCSRRRTRWSTACWPALLDLQGALLLACLWRPRVQGLGTAHQTPLATLHECVTWLRLEEAAASDLQTQETGACCVRKRHEASQLASRWHPTADLAGL